MNELIEIIKSKIAECPSNLQAYEDLFSVCRNIESESFKLSHDTNAELRRYVSSELKLSDSLALDDCESLFDLYKRTLLFDAPHFFDSYLLYLEINRKPSERFYQPRRKVFKRVVDALQKLADDELDELFISMPPRVGKTSILMFFTTWIIGRNSEASNLYSAYSDVITKAFYSGVLEIIQDPVTYLWKDVFPNAKIVGTNSADETLNIDRRKRYPSLTCRSLYGTLNGACDCNGFEISDDLIGGIEEALNKDRLISAWSKVDNNLLPRAKEKAKILWCGTRWSMIDPAGLRMELLQNDERFRNRRFEIINLPALNESDESNFDYEHSVGFSTDYYHQRRASFERNNDMASWAAQYMGEPIERDGALFSPAEMRYYNGELPDCAPDRIFLPIDPAFGGGDFVAGPVCFQYGYDIYVHDVVYDNGDKKITQPLIVNAVKSHKIELLKFEATKATESYAQEVNGMLRKSGLRPTIHTEPAPTNTSKEQRIFDAAPDIREMMIFREPGKRTKRYELFMQNVFSFKAFAKNKHDDAPDSLAMGIKMVTKVNQKARVFKRTF